MGAEISEDEMNFMNLIRAFCTLHGGSASKMHQGIPDAELKHKPKSRVRKSRKHGSQRSNGRQLPLFT